MILDFDCVNKQKRTVRFRRTEFLIWSIYGVHILIHDFHLCLSYQAWKKIVCLMERDVWITYKRDRLSCQGVCLQIPVL